MDMYVAYVCKTVRIKVTRVKPLQILVFRGQKWAKPLVHSVIYLFFSCTLDSNIFLFCSTIPSTWSYYWQEVLLCFLIFSQAVTDYTELEVQVNSESNSVFWLGSYLKPRVSVKMCSRPCSLCASIELILVFFLFSLVLNKSNGSLTSPTQSL